MKTFCSYYNQVICSSCSSIEQDYSSQVEAKNQKLKHLLADFGPFDLLAPVISAPVGFRNKAKFSITGSLDHPIIGLTGENELDQGREITNCPLHHSEINDLLKALPAFIKLANLQPYQIKLKTGELKGAIVYFSSETKEIYLRLILRSKESLDRIKKHSATLLTQFPKLTCLTANIQPVAHAILEGDEEIFFTPQHFIQHQLGEVHMTLHPQGFVQTNQEMALKLYATAAQWTLEASPSTFMELFSGQGAFSFFIQKHVKQALGVEINAEAVERANLTAKNLNLNHLSFVAQDAALVEKMVLDFNPELILVNPPRRGLAGVNQILKEVKSRYFIYSSCNAETLAQDLIQLKDHFTVVKAQVFDMFPNTDHFETLVLLESNAYRT
jgi:23S rRNA (uracil747-C5)-methyltransferase